MLSHAQFGVPKPKQYMISEKPVNENRIGTSKRMNLGGRLTGKQRVKVIRELGSMLIILTLKHRFTASS